ncbi:voltage-gated chloride channel [Aureococcus anophagefferens]|nr:voltage-gated chloride channel [Aureococcus anophagefferens]
MGALSDAPWKLMVADVLFFMAFGMSSVLVPLLIVSRERRRCPDDDGDPCGAVAAQRIVAYGLCGGVPQALAGAWLGGVADAGPASCSPAAAGGGALRRRRAAARYDLPFGALCASGALQGACGGSAALLAASFAYASRGAAAARRQRPLATATAPTRTAATRPWRPTTRRRPAAGPRTPTATRRRSPPRRRSPGSLVWVVAALPPTAGAPAAAPGLADAAAGLRALVAPGGDARALAAAWALVSCNNVGVGAIAAVPRRWSKAQVGAYVSLLGAAAAVGNVALEPLARRGARRSKRRDDRDVAVDLLLARSAASRPRCCRWASRP